MADRGYGQGRHVVIDLAGGVRARRPTGFAVRGATPGRDDLDRSVPVVFRPYALEFAWDRDSLSDLDLPVEGMSVAALEWQLVLPWWPDGARAFCLRPVDVQENREAYPEHMLRTMASDLSNPIDVTLRNDRWFVLDGVYRLLKARMLGALSVRVRKVPPESLERLASG